MMEQSERECTPSYCGCAAQHVGPSDLRCVRTDPASTRTPRQKKVKARLYCATFCFVSFIPIFVEHYVVEGGSIRETPSFFSYGWQWCGVLMK